MEVRLNIPKPTVDAPYQDDLCNRSQSGFFLRKLVEAFGSGCVISLNGKWGSGKTTFLSMWENDMIRNGYNIIHFNAWETDFMDDPLMGIIAEFKDLAGKKLVDQLKTATLEFGKVVMATLPSLIMGYVDSKLGTDLKETLKAGGDEFVANINQKLNSYITQKETVQRFRKELSIFAKTMSNEKPIIFVVDELDRCNPTYAVKTLERIKHLFAVSNIVFVVAIDQRQLCNSIRGYYGSEQFDAQDYLRRFFDVQYDLPNADPTEIIKESLRRFNFNDLFEINAQSTIKDTHAFLCLLYTGRGLSLRELEKFLLYARIVLASNVTNKIETVLFLVFLKLFDTDCYTKFTNYEDMSESDFIEYIEKHFSYAFFNTGSVVVIHTFYSVIAELLLSRYPPHIVEDKIIDDQGNLKFKITKFDKAQFIRSIRSVDNRFLNIQHLRDNINLATDERLYL